MLRKQISRIALAGVIAALAWSTTSSAQAASKGDRTLEWTADIDAPVAAVWELFTTKEGIEKWMTPLAEVDLRVGGTIRTNYNPQGTLGDESTIVHRILSFEPQRMLSMRVEKSPSGFPHAKVIEAAWGITYFEPITPHRTRVRLVSAGWGEGPEWDAAETFFQAGNEWTLNNLKELFVEKTAGGDAESAGPHVALALARRLIGGEWIGEQATPDGGTFRVRNVAIDGPDGASLSTRGWLGTDAGMFEHGQGQIWIEPGSGEVRFQNINEQGHVARGTITAHGSESMVWDWHARSDDGPGSHYRVTMTFTAADAYDLRIEHREEDGTYSTMVEMPFRRVKESPAEFRSVVPGSER